jgi:hypothetical protein
MSRLSAALVLGTVLLSLLLSNGRARADYLFNWDPDVPTIYSDNSGMSIELSDQPQSAPVSGSQRMIATVLSTFINSGIYRGDSGFSCRTVF